MSDNPELTTRSSRECKRKAAVICVSDRGSRGEREDASGKALIERLRAEGFDVQFYTVVPDEVPEISAALKKYADEERASLIVTTGGTGVSPRDVTPEATLAVVDRTVPGMAEAMRAASLLKTPHAMISRAAVGIRGVALIVNLPGSPKGALENLSVLLPALPHALEKIEGDPTECASG
jgi:molybdenum cofactor synthesis domain-containing protein